MDELDPTARIVWKLARNHTWGQPMPEEAVIAITTKDEDRSQYLRERYQMDGVAETGRFDHIVEHQACLGSAFGIDRERYTIGFAPLRVVVRRIGAYGRRSNVYHPFIRSRCHPTPSVFG